MTKNISENNYSKIYHYCESNSSKWDLEWIIYYKYILSFKVLNIMVPNIVGHVRPRAENQAFK